MESRSSKWSWSRLRRPKKQNGDQQQPPAAPESTPPRDDTLTESTPSASASVRTGPQPLDQSVPGSSTQTTPPLSAENTANPTNSGPGSPNHGAPEPSGQATLAPESNTPVAATQVQSVSTDPDSTNTQDLWARAFELLEAEDSELTTEYKTYLTGQYTNGADNNPPLSPALVQSVVDRLVQDRTKKQWRFSLLGTEVVVRNQAENMVKFLLWSDEVVKSALSTQPHAALAWSGVAIVLPLIQSAIGKHKALLDGFVTINEIQLYWRIVEKTYTQEPGGPNYDDLSLSLVKLYTEILKYQARAVCHLSKPQMSRAWSKSESWSEQASHVQTLSKERRETIPTFQRDKIQATCESQLQMMEESVSVLREIHQKLGEEARQTQQRYQDENEKKLFQDFASNYLEAKNFNPERLSGTCEWLLGDGRFCQWRDDSDTGLLLVLAGPGCGKSVLSRCLVDENLLSPGVATSKVCYFFFKDGYENRDNSASALTSLLHQLFCLDSSGELIKHGLASHTKLGKTLTGNFAELWDIFMACVKSPEAGEIVCVLDALDECTKGRKQLMEGLKKLYGKPAQTTEGMKLKFLITSRPYDYIESYFDPFVKVSSVSVDEKSTEIRQEIDLVIDDKVDEIAGKFSATGRKKVSDRLKSMDNRTYLWLTLIFNLIEEKKSLYSKLSSVEALLSELPSEVSDAYEDILSRSPDEEQTKKLLQMVLASTRPLTLDEVNVALTLALSGPKGFDSHADMKSDLWPSDGIKRVVENLCGLFISVYESRLYLIHQTAREFLVDPIPGTKWKGYLNLEASHAHLTECCVRYLSLVDPKPPQDQDSFMGSKIDYEEYEFVAYAGVHWLHHFESQGLPSDSLRKSARDLCRTDDLNVRFWLQVRHDAVTPTKGDFWRKTPDLTLACYYGLAAVVEDILHEPGINVNAPSSFFGTALQAAAGEGHDQVVLKLLEHGADANLTGGLFNTPLRAAAVGGHPTVIKLLFDKQYGDTDVNVKDGSYGTAFDSALKGGHTEVAMMFLDLGERLEVSEDTLLLAISSPRCVEAVSFLHEHRPDVVKITGDVVTVVARRGPEGDRVMTLLMEWAGETLHDTTDDVITGIFEDFDIDVVRLLCEKKEIEITEGVVTAAASNVTCGVQLMEWLFDRGGDEMPVTEGVVEAAALNFSCGDAVISVLKEKRPDEVKLTPRVAKLAKMNVLCGKRVLKVLQEDTPEVQKS